MRNSMRKEESEEKERNGIGKQETKRKIRRLTKEGDPKLELNHIFVHQAKSNDEIAKYDILGKNYQRYRSF